MISKKTNAVKNGVFFCTFILSLFSFIHKCIAVESDFLILLPDKADCIKQFAAEELKLHLELISSEKIDIIKGKDGKDGKKLVFFVGIAPDNDKKALAGEECRYLVEGNKVYLYGEDFIQNKNVSGIQAVLDEKYTRCGTLFAVYSFLENELGVVWFAPGNEGISFRKASKLQFKDNAFSWTPQLKQRQLRSMVREWNSKVDAYDKEFEISKELVEKKYIDEKIWLRRMRMGRSEIINYGHAFTKWWDKYGKTNPEFFALVKENGKRGPYDYGAAPDRVKMCVSNPALHKEIIAQWEQARNKNSVDTRYLNICENDSRGYCTCQTCVALDVRKEGEAFDDFMTDRYMWFANQMIKLVKEKDPAAKVFIYAYSDCRFPPRREKLSNDIVIGFVPDLLTAPEDLEKNYKDWQAAGAKEILLRPNDMHIDPGMPIGYEKKMFDNFSIGIKNGVFGTDYDTLHDFWETSGMANYILAKAHVYPDAPFEKWEDEYCSVYGAAKDDVKEYFKYWRNIFDTRFYPDREAIIKAGRYGNFRRGLMWKLANYYKTEDFDLTDKILEHADSANLTPAEKERLSHLILANKHARLTYDAIAAQGSAKVSPLEKINASRKLFAFRVENKDKLNMNWPLLFSLEKDFGDITGIIISKMFNEKMTPLFRTSLIWRFKIDPEDKGVQEKWQDLKWDAINKLWNNIRVDQGWTKQSDKSMPEEFRKQLEAYKGIGWYAINLPVDEKLRKSKVYLTFGAVDKSCWVYVNGKEAGKHVYTEPDDWKVPFSIRIDEYFTTDKIQTITVRTDPGGIGGIWKPVWIAVEKE